MAEENKPNDLPETIPPVVNPADNNGSNANAHWQKIADERYTENERLKKELEEVKKTQNTTEELRQRLQAIEADKERTRLESEYPDIEPDLLLGKTPEDQKSIVERQRKRATEHYKNSIDVNPPQYTKSELDTQITNIKNSGKNPVEKAQAVLALERLQRDAR